MIKKSGSWFSYGDTKLGQGRDAVKELLKDNPELTEELSQKITEAIQNKETTVKELYEKLNSDVTNYNRKSVF